VSYFCFFPLPVKIQGQKNPAKSLFCFPINEQSSKRNKDKVKGMLSSNVSYLAVESAELVNTNGRRCTTHSNHASCGDALCKVGLMVFLECKVIRVEDELEAQCAVRAVEDGKPGCIVGFLPKRMSERFPEFHGRFGQVLELYWESHNKFYREKSHRNIGMAKIAVMHYKTITQPEI
jgi:hypothetical protein